MQIRKASSHEDARYISLLGRITFAETFQSYFSHREDLAEYLGRTFSVAKIKNSLTKDNNVYWLASVDDFPVGYAKIKKQSPSEFITSETASQLQKIYILGDFHGLGIGKALLQAAVTEATHANSSNLWLSVLESNHKAIIFYKKLGFAAVGKRSFAIGRETFIFSVMQRSL
jgi:ribosomal protein S18 acetylase RimI-like enzyme